MSLPEAQCSKDHGLRPLPSPPLYLMLLTLLRWRKAADVKRAGRKASVVVARSCVAASRTARRACILCPRRGRREGGGSEVVNENVMRCDDQKANGTTGRQRLPITLCTGACQALPAHVSSLLVGVTTKANAASLFRSNKQAFFSSSLLEPWQN